MPTKEAIDCPDDSFDMRNAIKDGPGCRAVYEDSFGWQAFCTRKAGHDGDHHAHTYEVTDEKEIIICVEIWENNE